MLQRTFQVCLLTLLLAFNPLSYSSDASITSQSVPASMISGQTYEVSIEIFNNGENAWDPAALFRLGSQNPENNMTWGVHRIALPGTINPGVMFSLNFNVVAPTSPGVYNFQWRMLQENVTWFGDFSPNVAVTVSASSNNSPTVVLTSPTNNATYMAPATITLTASATDIGGSINKVEFFNGTNLLGTDTNGADGYSYTWTNVPQGSYSLTAKATDNLGAYTSSGSVGVTVNGVATTNPILHWSFDNATATDASPNANHGSLVGSPTAVSGQVNQALNFNGTNGSVNLSTVNALPSGNTPHTIAAWIKINSLPAARAWLLLLGQEGSGAHHWLINNNGVAQLGAWNGNQVQPTLGAGTWQHLAMTFDGTNLTGYINGTNIGTTPTSFNLQGLPLTLATSHIGENYFNGAVDELKIYDRALSATEVAALASTAPLTNTPPTVNLTSPANNASYTAPATINLTASASDTDGSIAQVAFFSGTTLLATDSNGADGYSYAWNNVPQGSYTLTAKATDNLGAVTSSSVVTVTVIALASTPINVALITNGGLSAASSTYNSNYAHQSANDGDRTGVNWGAGGGWNDATLDQYPDWLEITFSGPKTINEIDVFTVSDDLTVPPTLSTTFSNGGISDYEVQTWNGTSWVTLPNGNVTGNNKTLRQFSFAPITTNKIRVLVNNALNLNTPYTYSRILEVEAWTGSANPTNTPPTVNLTAPTNNASFTAPATINLTATATDTGGSIDRVDFFNGTNLLGTDNNGADGYSYAWSYVPQGSYSLTAKATDNLGVVATSNNVAVNVSPSPDTTPPSVPTGLAATPGVRQITLTWNPSTDNVSTTFTYYLEGCSEGQNSVCIPFGVLGATNFTVQSLADNTTYTYRIKAADQAGNMSAYSSTITATTLAPANTPPTVNLTAPANNASFSAPATINLTASASDSDGTISQVHFFQGTTLLGTGTNGADGYTYTWSNVPQGSYSLTAKATDNLGVVSTSAAINVTVTTVSNTPPTVTLTAPANNASYSAPANITINALATDGDGNIAKVEFFVGTTLLNTDTVTPYTYTWSGVPAGSYTLIAKATDNSAASASSSVNITVGVANTAPTVSITSPANGARFAPASNITINVNATDSDGSITQVDFYAGAQLIGTDTTAPYSLAWSAPAGSHSLTAKATDNLGLVGTSGPISIIVPVEVITYFHFDLVGSPQAATDEQGRLLWREEYHPYGSRLLIQDYGTNDRWFTGKPYEEDTGLSYFGARSYDPLLGRFMGVDPQGFDEKNLHSFNRYAYGNNNPYKYVDPDGHLPVFFLLLGIGLTANEIATSDVPMVGGGVAKTGVKAAEQLTGKEVSAGAEVVAKEIRLSRQVHGEAAEHAADAIKAGKPDVLTIARPGAPSNRAASTGGLAKVPGKQLDEYPPAMFKEGGAGASVRPISPRDNRSAGACIGNACRGLPDGTRIRITVED